MKERIRNNEVIQDEEVLVPSVPEEDMVLNVLMGKRWKVRQGNVMPWSADTYNAKQVTEIYTSSKPGVYSYIVWVDGRWIGSFGTEAVRKGFHPGKQNA